MTATPKLSILISNYNHGSFLEKTIDSIATTTYPSFELVLIDDASTDDSLKIIETIRKKYPFIRFYQNEKNLGVLGIANRGLSLARGEYVYYLGADDRLLPGFAERTMAVLEKHPEIPICCSDGMFKRIDESSRITKECLIPTNKPYLILPPPKLPKIFKRSKFWIQGHTVICKKSAIEKYGPYDEYLAGISDWFLFHKIAVNEGIAYIPESFAELRVSVTSFSGSIQGEALRQCYRHMFDLLEKDTITSKSFREGCIMRKMVKSLYSEMVRNPKMWKYILPLKVQNIEKFLEKHMGVKINSYLMNKTLSKI